MPLSVAAKAELVQLIDDLQEGVLGEPQLARLNQLLAASQECRREYIRRSVMYASLRSLETEPHQDASSTASLVLSEIDRRRRHQTGAAMPFADATAAVGQSRGLAPSFLPIDLHHAAGYLSSGWPVAYLIATMIVGIGLVIAAFTYVSQPAQVVRQSVPLHSPPSTLHSVVGRITGMVDCRWERKGLGIRDWGLEEGTKKGVQSLIPNPQSLVSLGDRFALRSGLLEVTYDTGAKVILQGPVTYEVESAAGGYLSLGKLTARIGGEGRGTGDGRVASGQWSVASEKSEIRNPKSQIPNFQISKFPNRSSPAPRLPPPAPLFVVRTPTATVTDLGTEFGVEVDRRGYTAAHVFRGSVRVQSAAGAGGSEGVAEALFENQSVRVEGPAGRPAAIHRATVDAMAFVRPEQFRKLVEERGLKPLHRWQAYSQQLRKDPALVAYYTFESVGRDSWLLPNVAATGPALDAEIQGPLWTSGRLPGKLALRFRGPGTGDKVILPEQQRFTFTTPFSIAVWFKASQFQPGCTPSLIAKGSAWRIQRYDDNTNYMNVNTNMQLINGQHYGLPPPRTEVTDGRWHHIVAVIEPTDARHRKCLYMDGRLEGEIEVPAPLAKNDNAVWLGQGMFANREFEGLIDEVAILARALSAAEIETIYNAGKPAETWAKETKTIE